jgi:2-polyprenyl-3-methyl-5-hydroxy-6-metoxy-1,4-benzoquinol methylase
MIRLGLLLSGTKMKKHIRNISSESIIKMYKDIFNIDVASYLSNIENIALWEDMESGLKFFDPPVSGDSLFYEQLEKFEWYYMDWKWEYEASLKYIQSSDSVLEIGSGKGAFLSALKKKGIKSYGMEYNKKQLLESKEKGLIVYHDTIESHSIKYPESYDVIVSFQVMEHIPNVESIILNSLKLLKKGGKLIISVWSDPQKL